MSLAKQILDIDAHFIRNALSLLDTQLERLQKIIDEDFSTSGESALVDDQEFLYGLGFVMAQRYLTAASKVLTIKNKKEAFALGPQTNGVAYASIVNAVANHWKHSDEWDFENLKKLSKETKELIEKIGVEVPAYAGYVASSVFTKMGLRQFKDLLPLLKEWSDAVETNNLT